MHTIALFIVLALSGQLGPDEPQPIDDNSPIYWVEQEVECISVAHIKDTGESVVYFWGLVQGEFAELDHRWMFHETTITRIGDEWVMTWLEEPYDEPRVFRVVRTKCYVESWEESNPALAQNNKGWMFQVGGPGLKAPPVIGR